MKRPNRGTIEGGTLWTFLISLAAHLVLFFFFLTGPNRYLRATPTPLESYTVELINPGVVSGNSGPIGPGSDPHSAPAAPPEGPQPPAAPAAGRPEESVVEKAPEPEIVNDPPPAPAPEVIEPQPAVAEPVVEPEAPVVEPEPAVVEPEPAEKPVQPDVRLPAKEPEPEKVAPKKPEPAKPAVAKKPEPTKPAVAKKPEPTKPAVAKKPEPTKPAVAKKPEPTKAAAVAKKPEPTKTAAVAKKPPGEKPAGPSAVAEADKTTAVAKSTPNAAGERDQRIADAVKRRAAASGKPSNDDLIAAAVRRRAAQVAGGQVGGGNGIAGPLSSGPGTGVGGGTVIGADYLLYKRRMEARIRDAWVWTGRDDGLESVVRFSVTADGEVDNVRTTRPSGDPTYDRSAERAVRAASPLGMVPPAYHQAFADVEMTFRARDIQR